MCYINCTLIYYISGFLFHIAIYWLVSYCYLLVLAIYWLVINDTILKVYVFFFRKRFYKLKLFILLVRATHFYAYMKNIFRVSMGIWTQRVTEPWNFPIKSVKVIYLKVVVGGGTQGKLHIHLTINTMCLSFLVAMFSILWCKISKRTW